MRECMCMFPAIQFFGNVKFNENLGHQNNYRPFEDK